MSQNDAKSFAAQIDTEFAATMDDAGELIAYIALDGLRRLVLKTPVDTGRARMNWNVGVGTIDATTTEQIDPSGQAAINDGAARLSGYDTAQGFPIINLSNNLPYIGRLDDGYSQQAPAGMVALTLVELEAAYDGVTV